MTMQMYATTQKKLTEFFCILSFRISEENGKSKWQNHEISGKPEVECGDKTIEVVFLTEALFEGDFLCINCCWVF